MIGADIQESDIRVDMADGDQVESLIAEISRRAPDGLDGLVPCAGVGAESPNVALIPQVNYFATVALVEGLMPALEMHGGSVLPICSNSATLMPHLTPAPRSNRLEAAEFGDDSKRSGTRPNSLCRPVCVPDYGYRLDMLVLYLILALVFTGVLVLLCEWAHARFPQYRIGNSDGNRLAGRRLNLIANFATVFAMFVIAITVFGDYLIREGPSLWYEPVVFLLVFDFAYYCMHRTLHHPTLMRLLHGVHHRISHPTAVESLYEHPIDTVLAFTLLFACMAVVGPLGVTSFAVASLLYMTIFGLGHANLDLPFKAMAPLNHWARRHDAHHAQRSVNFGSITPVWDRLFNTEAAPTRR